MDDKKEQVYVISDDLLRAVVGKVAEVNSAVQEHTVQVKNMSEAMNMLPLYEKNLDVVMDGVVKLRESVEEAESGLTALGKEIAGLKNSIHEQVLRVEDIPYRINIPVHSIDALSEKLVEHAQLFEKPLRKDVHYRHVVGGTVWGWLLLVMVIVGQSTVLFHAWDRAREYERADIKYRYVGLKLDPTTQRAINEAEQADLTDPDSLKTTVKAEEERRRELFKNMMDKARLDSEQVRLNRGKKIQ